MDWLLIQVSPAALLRMHFINRSGEMERGMMPLTPLEIEPHTDLIQPRIKNGCAVPRRVHPLRLQRLRRWCNGQIFADDAKVCTLVAPRGRPDLFLSHERCKDKGHFCGGACGSLSGASLKNCIKGKGALIGNF
jgi:hypothetical protein